jgi:hypothetical protein
MDIFEESVFIEARVHATLFSSEKESDALVK